MMRRLYLMRHAQAESFGPHGDKDRRLSTRGRLQAREVGERLAGARIERALVSDAERTRETFAELRLPDVDGVPVHVEFRAELYDAGTRTMLARIAETPDEVRTLLVLGHAPTIPALAGEFARAFDRAGAALAHSSFPTAAIGAFDVEVPWGELADFDPYDYADPGPDEAPEPHCPVRPSTD